MARVEALATRLHHESQGMRQTIDGITQELRAARVERQLRRTNLVPRGESFSPQDPALELMAQQMAEMSHKMAEMEKLKLT
jgi:hypothetical protein